MLKHNNPRPRVEHRDIARFLGIDQNVIRSSHGHSTVHTFPESFMQIGSSRFLVMLLTKKQRKKDTYKQRNTPSPMYRGEVIKWRKIKCRWYERRRLLESNCNSSIDKHVVQMWTGHTFLWHALHIAVACLSGIVPSTAKAGSWNVHPLIAPGF